jgi:hypothetical protein
MEGYMTNDEILLELYKMNDNYHNAKDNLIWISTSLYLTISLSLCTLFLSPSFHICDTQKKLILLGIILVSSLFAVYIGFLNWYKAKSVYITNIQNDLLKKHSDTDIQRLKIVNSLNPIFTSIRRKKKLYKKVINILEDESNVDNDKVKNAIDYLKIEIEKQEEKKKGKIAIYFRNGITGHIIHLLLIADLIILIKSLLQ